MIATSIEQSRRLINAGVNPDTADMYYIGVQRWDGNDYSLTGEHNLLVKANDDEHYEYMTKNFGISMDEDEGTYFMPAWSVGALWDILPDTFCVSKAIAEVSIVLIEKFVGIIEREKKSI